MFSGESFDELMAEIRLLLQFPRNSRMAGIKLQRDAEADMHQAAQRLFSFPHKHYLRHKRSCECAHGLYLHDTGAIQHA